MEFLRIIYEVSVYNGVRGFFFPFNKDAAKRGILHEQYIHLKFIHYNPSFFLTYGVYLFCSDKFMHLSSVSMGELIFTFYISSYIL